MSQYQFYYNLNQLKIWIILFSNFDGGIFNLIKRIFRVLELSFDVSIICPHKMIWSFLFFLIADAQNPCVPYDPNNPGSPWERYCRSGRDFIIPLGNYQSFGSKNHDTCQEYHLCTNLKSSKWLWRDQFLISGLDREWLSEIRKIILTGTKFFHIFDA